MQDEVEDIYFPTFAGLVKNHAGLKVWAKAAGIYPEIVCHPPLLTESPRPLKLSWFGLRIGVTTNEPSFICFSGCLLLLALLISVLLVFVWEVESPHKSRRCCSCSPSSTSHISLWGKQYFTDYFQLEIAYRDFDIFSRHRPMEQGLQTR